MSGALDRDVALTVSLDASRAEAALDRFNDTLHQTGQIGARAGKATADAFNAADPALGRLNARVLEMGVRFQQTGQISTRALAAVGVDLKNLEVEYGKTTSAVDKLSASQRQFLTVSQAAYKEAITRQREYNDSLQQVNRQTHQWTGLGNAIEGLGGKLGTVAKIAGGVFAAFTAGWEAGRRLDKWLEKSITWWKKWRDAAASAIVGAQTDLVRLTDDPRFKGTRTEALLPKIIAKQGRAAGDYKKALEDGTKETEKADKATKVWTSDLESLHQSLADTTRNVREQLAAGIPYGQVIEANKGKLSDLYDRTLLLNVALTEQQRRFLSAGEAAANYGKKLPLGQSFADFVKKEGVFTGGATIFGSEFDQQARFDELDAFQDQQNSQQAAFNREQRDLWLAAMDESTEHFLAAVDQFSTDMADVFTAGVIGGAAGFAEAASGLFLRGVNDGAKNIFTNLARIAFGAPPERGQFEQGLVGDTQSAAAVIEANKQNAAILNAASTVVGTVGQTIQIFDNAKKGQEVSVLATTAAFTAAGASIGGWIGALVGAIAGLTISLLANAKAQREQPYASYGIRNGVPYVEAFPGKERQFENITNQMFNDMLSRMQTTLEETQNDYISLLMRFPDAIAESVTAANFAPTMDKYKTKGLGFLHWFVRALFPTEAVIASFTSDKYRGNAQHIVTQQGQIGNPLWDKNAQKNFMQDFNDWVNNTLPKEIIAGFEAPLQAGFETLGLTAEKFHQIWTRLQAINPKDAIKSLNELFDALTAFKQAEEFLSKRLFGGAGFVFEGGLLPEARADLARSFADQLAQADVGLVELGATIQNLVGPEQITQAKAWGDALLQRQQAVQEWFKQVAQLIDQIVDGYQDSIRDLELQGLKKADGTPDIQAQVEYLKKYADTLWGQITTATTPEEVAMYSTELQKTILQIQQLGGSLGADAAEAYRLWAIEQLKAAQALVVGQLEKLAQDVADQNAAFLDAIQGFIDAFREATDALTEETPPPTDTEPPDPDASGRPRGSGRPGYGSGSLRTESGPAPPAALSYAPTATLEVGGAYIAQHAALVEAISTATTAGNAASALTLAEVRDAIREAVQILAAGRDLRVHNELAVEIEGQTIIYENAPDSGGFERREIAARGR